MRELTYFERHVNGEGSFFYLLRNEYLPPLPGRDLRYWRACCARGRCVVNQSDDTPTLSEEAWLELSGLHADWLEAQRNLAMGLRANGESRTVPQSAVSS